MFESALLTLLKQEARWRDNPLLVKVYQTDGAAEVGHAR